MSYIREALHKIEESNSVITDISLTSAQVKLAESDLLEDKQKLREIIANKLKISVDDLPPLITEGKQSLKQFVNYYNKNIYPKYKGVIIDLMGIIGKGIGRGEILLSILHQNITIGGGNSPYDITFGNDYAELKEVIKSGDKLKNFRFGTLMKEALNHVYEDIVRYIKTMSSLNPKMFPPDQIKKSINKGELTKWLTLAKNNEKNILTDKKFLDVEIDNLLNVYIDGEILGNIQRIDTINRLKQHFENTDTITYSKIIKKVNDVIKKDKMPYIMIVGQKSTKSEIGKIYYLENLAPVEVEAVTQGKIKIYKPIDKIK